MNPYDSHHVQPMSVMGLTMAQVTALNDPQNQGRVKVSMQLKGQNMETDWIAIASPFASNNAGMMLLPEVNDQALVGFVHGDVNNPVVLGFFWNGKIAPPVAEADKQQKQRILQTSEGKVINLNDADNNITVTDGKNNSIAIDTANKAINLDSAGNLTIKASNALNIVANSIDITTSDGAIAIKLSSKGIEVTGGPATKLKADEINLN